MQASTNVSIVIVSFNSRQITIRCLEHLFANTKGIDFEVIVFDNNSSDGSADAIEKLFSQVKIIRSSKNLGFASGNNEAAKRASGKYILLLNPDTIVVTSALKKLYEFAIANPQAGAWGGVCTLPDGSIDPGCRQVTPSLAKKVKHLFTEAKKDAEKMPRGEDFSGPVDVLSGAFMMLPMDLWHQLGGFDESFKLYSEETDLCRRIQKAGYEILMSGSARIVHDTGSGEPDDPDRAVFMARGDIHFFRKHYSVPAAILAAFLIWLHGFERLVGSYLLMPFIGPQKSHSLRRRFLRIALMPHLWWNGWRNRQL